MSRETHDTLREVQDLIRHSVPSGDAAVIVARALTLLRDHLLRQKAAQTPRPRTGRGREKPIVAVEPAPDIYQDMPPSSRGIPARVRRAVWARDGARCAFVGADGRCDARTLLEFHHVRPFAAGGESDETNIELRCRAHNAHEAEVFFGKAHGGDRAVAPARRDRAAPREATAG